MKVSLTKLKLSYQILFIVLFIPSVLVGSLLYYSALQHVNIKNKPLEQIGLFTSTSVAEKTDRNLQGSFQDVQAFAVNELAVQALTTNASNSDIQAFMNKMTAYYALYELTMLCDMSGNVIAVNTRDMNGKVISSQYLIGKNVNFKEWYRSSIVVGGPKTGAFYSDFNEDEDVAKIYQNKGYGMDFSAPVRNAEGTIIGVWRNRASWKELTQQIRNESETSLQKDVPGALILLMDKQGHLIDADQEDNILKVSIGQNNLLKNFEFKYAGIDINENDYFYGWSASNGAHKFDGNKWTFVTLIPKVKLSDYNIYLHSDWTGLMLFSVSLLFGGLIISFFFVRRFSKRMNQLKYSIQQLSKGEPEEIVAVKYHDEIGEMSLALNTLNENFKNVADFSNDIGKGVFSASFTPLGNNDILGISLLKMRENLQLTQSENEQYQWTSAAIAKFGEVLHEHTSEEDKYRKIISYLAKTIKANQAALFIINKETHEPYLELKGGYAISAERLKMTVISEEEGLVGQCMNDMEIIRMKNIPPDYIQALESGLGSAIPKEIILLPIKFNDKAEGVLEFSTFSTLAPHVIHFLEKAAEYIGSYIAQLRVTDQSEKILQASLDKKQKKTRQEELMK